MRILRLQYGQPRHLLFRVPSAGATDHLNVAVAASYVEAALPESVPPTTTRITPAVTITAAHILAMVRFS